LNRVRALAALWSSAEPAVAEHSQSTQALITTGTLNYFATPQANVTAVEFA
jgi:hypothetical protein